MEVKFKTNLWFVGYDAKNILSSNCLQTWASTGTPVDKHYVKAELERVSEKMMLTI